jgi:hypothetical protein
MSEEKNSSETELPKIESIVDLVSEETDSDLDGLIQEIIQAVDNKAKEIEKELETNPKKGTRKKSK